ncbi:hypothetical protein COW36_20065 [bacterium (Candidatus Blackallbacteria) CG17_big_fil_post_rev_8_21_14_2_50_48_46]|uniref:YkuD domain-containing protein n=1 Tax=bacterium (Candidatus Blackallbacteria) CG17_big_fil_post_rev_8_21_14_2_50_48_46 TaxID=2014261 RepID=A0A2M7FZ80_9BACT|nr:MAG: hypothetical protein COW64_22390 [bacterium (Candidatus Blackallbacteria) CG18_big_fil_WC_8_21_14_2_50_49_26]PIW14704.1 MAG: hypothetical protein COW36_20065 [bacterium (Candidatus Blackallbacteria) CG17_big_fil_post_rev_8_21_14_2_50_48_46]PIW50806.1 MAG: hypothetical protein COW20_00880 [bacterium (Candidatus Blackallbacteria) CG13_big_fil_rev_8_21_14_2_50_49_14]
MTGLLAGLALSLGLLSPLPENPIPPQSQQMLRVISADWNAVPAKLQRFERPNSETAWQAVGSAMPVVVGKKGMGWGQGLHSKALAAPEAFRKEGDKRAPAGVFRLGTVFGLARPETVKPWLKMPYLLLQDETRCIGARESVYYNQIVEQNQVKRDWKHDGDNENMKLDALRDEGAYRWGLFVEHNTPPDRVSGSCIFVHLWKGDGSGTSGCTALSKQNIEILLHWLDQSKNPILVQMPEAEYQALKAAWLLP